MQNFSTEEIYGSLLEKCIDAFSMNKFNFSLQPEYIRICKRLKGTKYEDEVRKYVQDVISFILNRIENSYKKSYEVTSDIQVINWLDVLDYLDNK